MSSSLDSGSRDRTSTTNLTPERAAETIKNVASSIREASSKIREMVRTIHQGGAIEEIAQAIQEASIATRDTAREISNTKTLEIVTLLGVRLRPQKKQRW